MDCFYINLASQTDRRQFIEKNFSDHRSPEWSISRFEAKDIAYVTDHDVNGAAKAGEKGCFISHRDLIQEQLLSDSPIMIMEDDAMFGPETCKAIDMSLAAAQGVDWDIIFTDICASDVGTWPELVRMRRAFSASKSLRLIDLSRIQFAGSTSYIVNGKSKRALSEILESYESVDLPYDLYVRSLIHQGKIKAYSVFPFLTTVSPLADASSVETRDLSSPDIIWNTFRRAIWIDRDFEEVGKSLEYIMDNYFDQETAIFGVLFQAMLSEKL